MRDGAMLVIDAGVTALAVALAAVLVVHLVRAPRTALAVIGVLSSTLALAAAIWAPPGSGWDAALNTVGYALVFTAYPDGRISPRWLALPVVFLVAVAGADLLLGTAFVTALPGQLLHLSGAALIVVAVHRYRRRLSTAERESMRWALLGTAVTFIGMPVLIATAVLSGTAAAGIGAWGEHAAAVLVCATPLALTIGLVAPRVGPVDSALRHTLCVLMTAAPLAVVSAVILAVAPPPAGSWAAVTAAALLAVPLWLAARRLADRFVYQRRLSPARALRLLDERLAATADPAQASQIVADLTAKALASPRVRVEGPRLRQAVSSATPADDATATSLSDTPRESARSPASPLAEPVTQPVRYGGAEIALITAEPRRAETSLTRADRAVLAQIATRSAPALHAARTVAALVDARAALVVAHEEERKHLRRDLHDDLVPTLVGLRLTASGLARLLADQDTLAATVRSIETDIDAAIAQTRALAYGLRPPVLDDGGLIAAVRNRARSDDALRIRISASDEPLEVAAAVEVAALRVVQEAVTNVRRHAGATRCDVRIERTPDALRVVVEDDGCGMPDAPVPGLGLASMRERVAELGGSVRVQRAALGGVRVSAIIPAGA